MRDEVEKSRQERRFTLLCRGCENNYAFIEVRSVWNDVLEISCFH